MSTRALLSAGLAVALAACASGGGLEEDPNAPQACVRVDNTGGGGAAGQVFLVNGNRPTAGEDYRSAGGERIRIGEVSMGRQVRRCIRRPAFGGSWYMVVEQVSGDRLDPADRLNPETNRLRGVQDLSESFYLSPGDEIVWNLRLNRISVERIGA